MKLFQRTTFNHTPHILATVFLCGLWLPIWAISAMSFNPPYLCSFCGYSDAVKYLMYPNLRAQEAGSAKIAAAESQRKKEAYRENASIKGFSLNWLGEMWAARTSESRVLWIGGAVIIALGLIVSVIVAVNSGAHGSGGQLSPPISNAVPSPPPQDLIAARRAFADGLAAAAKKQQVNVAVEGSAAEILRFEGKGVNADFADKFKASPDYVTALKVRFRTVYFNNGKFGRSLSMP